MVIGLAPSRPTRARGLKPMLPLSIARYERVAPHAGAWIETLHHLAMIAHTDSRAPRGRVD